MQHPQPPINILPEKAKESARVGEWRMVEVFKPMARLGGSSGE
jgi:hypothetical protein